MSISRDTALAMIQKYPDRVPVKVLTKGNMSIHRTKFLVPLDLTLGNLLIVIRKFLSKVENYEALYIFVGGRMYPNNFTLSKIWQDQEEKHFLTIIVAKENTFG